jgi:putative oxidoreductase
MLDTGLLILRLVIGLLLAGHGAQKLFGVFGGHGLKGTSGWLGSMGLRPAGLWAFMAGVSEFGGGVLVALGLLTPLGSVAVISAMLVAILLAHRQALWVTEGGMEYNVVLIAAAVALIFTGPGAFSLDALFALSIPAALTAIAAALALLTIFVLLGTRKAQAPSAASGD